METVQSLVRATRHRVDRRRPRTPRRAVSVRPQAAFACDDRRAAAPRPRTRATSSLIMGLPAAGKSVVAESLVALGYDRLNRDNAGGSLSDLLPKLDPLIGSGSSRIVLDNTYVSRKSRAGVIETASRHGLPVRCLYLSTTVEDAQVNAVSRIVSRYGRLLEPDEMQTISKRDVAAFGPAVQFRFQRELEPPDPAEGFARSTSCHSNACGTPRSPTRPCSSGATGSCAAADRADARRALPTMSRCLRNVARCCSAMRRRLALARTVVAA